MGQKKVEDKVDVASGRCRRKIIHPFWQNFTASQSLFEKPSVFKVSSMTVIRLWAAIISKFTVWWGDSAQFHWLAVSNSLQPAHRHVYSHRTPLSFLASRDLTVKTINFFSFDEAEKVEDEVDVASGRCRRKLPSNFSQNFIVSQSFSKNPVFSRPRPWL